ncbi:NADPH-dependent FMN reductase [Salinibacillus xinjiangensis]|uniref:NADH-dependent FMN reductase n=1 Tax=Salinibacillus xinjiangensis TaxID=1229268 RepID=A0A6G1X8L8_9BACI|nr:NADPH-dependent FMN reductase [Salinibacillus xinjiangensis]MRG87287.1 NADH-dependent FMN reductase [Salinibacillus xinjiangensis]
MKVLLLNGTIIGDKTKAMLKEVDQYLQKINDKLEIKHVYLEDYDLQFCDGRPAEEYNEDTQKLIEEISNADGYIVATPVFQGSIPGTLKNMFDLISPYAMRYKPVAIVANGGTFQHHLVVENQLKPILDYFRCLVTPNYVYTHSSHFSTQNELIDEDVKSRLKELSRVFNEYLGMSKKVEEN